MTTETTIFDQITSAREQLAAVTLTYTRLHQEWVSTCFSLASAAGSVPGSEIMERMNPVSLAAQAAYAAHREVAIAEAVLAGLTELANRRQGAEG